MKFKVSALVGVLLTAATCLQAVTVAITSPREYEVIQRDADNRGRIPVTGQISELNGKTISLQVRLSTNGNLGQWRELSSSISRDSFSGSIEAGAGGWYRLEARALSGSAVLGEAVVERVGLGEVFVVAGQSNSANHGEERQSASSDQVVTYDGRQWRLCRDPQPGASGEGGSFLPPFGDAIARRFGVPVGFVACGIGATSVREWLPKGTKFPNPPTLTGRVQQLPTGEWVSNGDAYEMLIARTRPLGRNGFRAVLWHQGESDANQSDPTRTLPGALYSEYLRKLIRESRVALAWDVPWFVAQVSYHVPGDESSPDIRAAQASLCKDGLALAGPDTDALKGKFRENGGRGVHFSGAGLRAHAAAWFDKVAPWLEAMLPGQQSSP